MARQSARSGAPAAAALASAALASALFACAAFAAGPALAHHSAAIYEHDKTITLKGVVKTLEWSNPHGFIEMLGATDGGKTRDWSIEMEGPNVMHREGWSRNSLMPGDHITARVMPLKDGRPGARLVDVIKADGTVLHLFTPGAAGA